MAAPGMKMIHVYSRIPRLASIIQQRLPDVKIIDVQELIKTKKKTDNVKEAEVVLLKDAEVLVMDNFLFPQIADSVPNLRWAQGSWAGVEGLVKYFKDKTKPTFPVTRMAGESFSLLMAEYVVSNIILHERGFKTVFINQSEKKWDESGNIHNYRSLQDLNVAILGLGNIGKEVARTLKTFHSTIHAYTRTKPSSDNVCKDVDKYWHTGELSQLLAHCDYIVNILPSTEDTNNLLGITNLRQTQKHPVLINIGRGNVFSCEDICTAIEEGFISHAILDVFETEPLPTDSPLWVNPKITITPHVAGVSRPQDVAFTFVENYQRFQDGRPLLNKIDWDAGY